LRHERILRPDCAHRRRGHAAQKRLEPGVAAVLPKGIRQVGAKRSAAERELSTRQLIARALKEATGADVGLQPAGQTAEVRARRSCLAVPGSQPRFHAKADRSAADQIFLDLEDSVAPAAKEKAREQVVDWARARGLDAYDRRTQTGLLRNLVVREGRRSGQIQVRLVTGPGRIDADGLVAALPGVSGVLWTRSDSLGETTHNGETELLAGDDRIDEEIGPLRVRISPQAFFQTNTEMAEVLYGVAADYALYGRAPEAHGGRARTELGRGFPGPVR